MDSTETKTSNLPAFERWLEVARPKAKLWRFVIGVVIVMVTWMIWSAAIVLTYAFAFIDWSNWLDAQLALDDLMNGTTPIAIATLLITFFGLWLGVWLALRLMHGQEFWTVVSLEKSIRWREFLIGVAMIAGYMAANMSISFAAGLPTGERSDLSLIAWATMAVPICILIFFQASGEELLFRGYAVQQLGARFRNPLIWGVLPSLAFGLFHYSNGTFAEYSAYYVIATTLFALTAAVAVWRTGSLSMAMGMHTANNIGSFLIAGTKDSMNSTQLWLWSVDDVMRSAPYDVALLILLLLFMLSPWAPLPKGQPFSLRKEMRAAP